MRKRLLFSLLLSAVAFAGFSQSQSIGLIGSATPTGWDSDTDMVQDPDSAHLWTLDITLTAGAVKFRQNDAWDINWGSTTFPYGVGTQGGADIPIPAGGQFSVKFNSLTGAYEFSVASDIGILGSAAPKGWDSDVNMFQDPVDPNKYSITLNLVQGAAKFRQNDSWDVNWGAPDFPTGVGVQGGPDIPIPAAGKYLINFDKSTGAYSFEEILEYQKISIIGSATPGGWNTDTELTKQADNANLWKGVVTLVDGELKFRANNAWTINWGGGEFPADTGVLNSPNNIVATAGEYQVEFNTETFEYSFLLIVDYASVGIVGSATPGGWDTDTDMNKDPNDKSKWKLRLILTDGEAQFRANNAWDAFWGGSSFPSGVATLEESVTIPVPAGEYVVTFNSTTGEYNFELLVLYNTVGLVGPSTPLATWDTDVDMTKDAVDESFWFINSIDLTDGFCKFRAEDAWTVNWGLAQWPSGIGVQNGANIPITAGTYRVTLNSATGEYAFADPVSTVDLLQSNSIALSPNPASQVVNIEIKEASLRGDVQVLIFDQMGRQVMSQKMNVQASAPVNVSSLTPGNYLVHISNGKYVVGRTLVVVD